MNIFFGVTKDNIIVSSYVYRKRDNGYELDVLKKGWVKVKVIFTIKDNEPVLVNSNV